MTGQAGIEPAGPAGSPAVGGGRRLVRWGAGLLLGVHAAILFVALPVLALVFLLSLFEGGDVALKHRLLVWAPVAGLGNVVTGVLLCSAAVAVFRNAPDGRTRLPITSGLLLGLAVGWAWVWQSELLTVPSVLALWVVLTGPSLVAHALVQASEGLRPHIAAPRAEHQDDRHGPETQPR